MSDILSYISTKVENGVKFDTLVGNLLYYKPEIWGYSEQDFESISSDFGVPSNSLYYLPVGNYKLTNLPNSPLNTNFVNISVFEQNGNKIIICSVTDTEKYVTELNSEESDVIWTKMSTIDENGATIVSFYIGKTPPSDTSMIWIDISKLDTDEEVYLRYHSDISSTWVSYIYPDAMLQSIYDVNKVKKDPYAALSEAITALVGNKIVEFNLHQNNSDIHLSNEERLVYESLIPKDQVSLIFAEDGDLYNTLLQNIRETISSSFDYSDINDVYNESKDIYDNHALRHITASKVNDWNSKSNSTHTHNLDGRVTISSTNISKNKSFPSDKIDPAVKERVYKIASFDILASASNVNGLLNTTYHNGNTLYTEDSSGNMVWKKIIDNTKFGTSNYAQGLLDFSNSTSGVSTLSYDTLEDVPTTAAEYNIGNAVSHAAFNSVVDATHYLYTPSEYAIESIGDKDVYIGVQRTLSENGGGTDEYPMSTAHAELDVIIAANSTSKSNTSSKLCKCNCEPDEHAYIERWIEVPISDKYRYWQSICYGNGKFVAVSGNSPSIVAYSTDGLTWTEVTIPSSPWLFTGICYGDGKYIIISNYSYGAYYSTDAINWTVAYIDDESKYIPWQSICYGDGKFVAVATSSNVVAYSYDGITWSKSTISESNRYWYSVCYGNDKFVAVVYDSNIFAYSYDGITWTEGTISETNRNWYSVCYGKDKFVAISYGSKVFAYSTDGITWIEMEVGNTTRYWESICYSNDKFMVIASNSNIFAYSLDGIKWFEEHIGNDNIYWNSICYGNGRCVATAYNNNISTMIIDYCGMPCCVATGLSVIPCDCSIDKYFSSTYVNDEDNPNWNTVGLGKMVKVDKSCTNEVIRQKYSINNHEYDVKVLWDPNVGVVFDLGVAEATQTCQSMHDNFISHIPGVQAAIELYNKRFAEEGLI